MKETARECFEEAVKFEEKGATVPITSERILSVISKNVPSVSPVEMKRYLELKSRMEHSDKKQYAPSGRFFFRSRIKKEIKDAICALSLLEANNNNQIYLR